MAAQTPFTIAVRCARPPASRRRATRLAAVVVATLTLALMAGCGSDGGDPEVDVQGAQTADGGGEQSTDGGGGDGGGDGGGEIEPDEGGAEKVSINVASLPFGGAAEATGDLTQCVTVGLNGELSVPEGAVLTVSVGFSSDLFALDPAACEGIDGPWCDGWEVTGTPGGCNIGVTATRAPEEGEAPPTTFMSGVLTCDAAVQDQCEQLQSQLSEAITTIQFALPTVPEPEGETTG